MPADFEVYFRALAATPVDAKTEHSDRGALEALLQAAANDAEPGAHVQHEPPRDKSGGGSPDFKVTRQGRIAGYVEVKTIDENLSKVLKSDQIKKYRKLSDNIVLTDYLEFCWLKPDGETVRERLAYSDDLSSKTLRLKPESVEAVRLLLRGFFSAAPQRIGRSHDLALALASRAAMLRDFLTTELTRQQKDHTEGRLFALFQAFRDQVFHDLTIADFADAFAQMLAYGLFLARLNAGPAQTITLTNVRQFIPGSFALIRELVRFLDEMGEAEYRDIRWVIDEILSIVNGVDLGAIHNDLSFRSRKAISRKMRAGDEEEHRLFERDPFIYFYEDFLKAYDPAMRKGRGVYYTPPPVVNFIVRAVDDILKDKFGIRDGLADHRKVTVLDFAAGTGTFLLEVFERIFANIGGADAGRADQIVREHIAKNLYGFEYLIAPYTIAHLKLSQYLKDKGYPLRDDERLQVFLTNTLEPVKPERNFLMPALAAEVEAAQRVKDQPILVITGNPPYSGHSKNNGSWIKEQIDAYKFTIEQDENGLTVHKPLGERNPKWLNDDYVKFIRFAQQKIDAVDEGVVGIITNHSWLDNPTFRGMRQSLMRTFDQIYVLDLHGNTKKKEKAADGSKDENVFDIEQGVAVSLFVKKAGLEKGVWRGDLWGRRLEKYRSVAEADLTNIGFGRIDPVSDNYLFAKQNAEVRALYQAGYSLIDIFPINVLGF
ncbi:N-6 DNA methylase [Caulobacter sp. SSI4214]|uniref:N-6 DNA methylase n=1 Tax=Caulobacter sp. SSI4214 TaxID=2575739 RepID=UPI00143BAC7F|nr:N-6 DNA methylase [Caulobacter sp. SSI4214]